MSLDVTHDEIEELYETYQESGSLLQEEFETLFRFARARTRPTAGDIADDLNRIQEAIAQGKTTSLCFYDSHSLIDRFLSLKEAAERANENGVQVKGAGKLAQDLDYLFRRVGFLKGPSDTGRSYCEPTD